MTLSQKNYSVSPRIQRLKKEILSTKREISIERAILMTESFLKTPGEPTIIRRAKALRHILNHIKIKVTSDELIVGNRSLLPRAGVVAPECSIRWLNEELDTISIRGQESFFISEENKRKLREEIFPYWKGKTLKNEIEASLSQETKIAREAKVFTLNQTTHNQGHILPHVEKWLRKGIRELRNQVKEKLLVSHNDREKINFYRAVDISLKGASEFILRYAKLAESKAKQSTGEKREHFGIIMTNCEHILVNPPSTFHQAVQSLWFLFLMLHIESVASSFSPGRIDQYLFPFYSNDIQENILTPEKALEIMECLWLKFNEIVLLRPAKEVKYFAGFPIGFNVALGGINEKGKDVTNELSFLCLKASADIRMPQPNLSVRLHNRTSQKFLMEVSQVISLGFGMPQLFNDEIIIPALLNRGIKPDDARNYAIIGCVELGIPGKSLGLSDAALFNLPKLLELVINKGKDRLTKRKAIFLDKSNGHFNSYESLEKALEKEMDYFVDQMVAGCNIVDQVQARILPTPFLSSVMDECLRKGEDVSRGGARYNFTGPQAIGVANLADSLMAIKKFVYQEQQIDLLSLNHLLDKNFLEDEPLRQRLLNFSPKFGNDIDEVDQIARKWARHYCLLVERNKNPRGGSYQPGLYTISAHVPLGLVVGATPDGRRAREPLADGGLSPVREREKKGPTAVLKSVSKIDQLLSSNGSLLNLKFHPSVFGGEKSLKKFADFLAGFVQLKCTHVQFNIISTDILQQAKKNPEAFGDLVVRVAGYSAYFVELDESLQNDIITRTEYAGL